MWALEGLTWLWWGCSERWATATGFPRENVINDGTTGSTGGIGSLADLWLALSSRNMLDSDVMVSPPTHTHTRALSQALCVTLEMN